MESRANLMQRGEVGKPAHVRNATCMHDRRSNVVDELLLDELTGNAAFSGMRVKITLE